MITEVALLANEIRFLINLNLPTPNKQPENNKKEVQHIHKYTALLRLFCHITLKPRPFTDFHKFSLRVYSNSVHILFSHKGFLGEQRY